VQYCCTKVKVVYNRKHRKHYVRVWRSLDRLGWCGADDVGNAVRVVTQAGLLAIVCGFGVCQ